jgi:hypothetical protein
MRLEKSLGDESKLGKSFGGEVESGKFMIGDEEWWIAMFAAPSSSSHHHLNHYHHLTPILHHDEPEGGNLTNLACKQHLLVVHIWMCRHGLVSTS